MEDHFVDLRSCICETDSEMSRFRHLVVIAVMATDIADPALREWREYCWGHAFASSDCDDDPEKANRKASIVLENILQASDVSHTMQHWNTYRKWNQRLFEEMYHAYQQGRAEQDPSLGWYEEELRFFDHYIIPLASKLKDCGVFGVSSDEYLSYATENRHEWAQQGRDIVKDMMSKLQAKRDTL